MNTSNFLGSTWGIWDLQVQTILDDGYSPLKNYYQSVKNEDETKWNSFVAKVGGEEKALAFDSKGYFADAKVPKKERCYNYARTVLSFIEIYRPSLRCIGITDHNYDDDILLDTFADLNKKSVCKSLCGVEMNVGGVHVLVFFGFPPFAKASHSEGIKTFLDNVGVNKPKTEGVYSVCHKGMKEVLDLVRREKGICVFAHCNSDNGLFQERGKTDRIFLTDIYNYHNPIVLQAISKKSLDAVFSAQISPKRGTFRSTAIPTLGSDSRSLREMGRPDNEGNYCWIKAEPTFEGLRQAMYEPETRVSIDENPPVDPPQRIGKVEWNFPSGTRIGEDDFCLMGNTVLSLSPNYTCFIGGRGTGKSTILNLINEKLSPDSDGFFSEHLLRDKSSQTLAVKDVVKIDDDKEQTNIEYLSQNEVEQFASHSKEFTEAIYRRLEKRSSGKIKNLGDVLNIGLKEVDDHIASWKSRSQIQETLSRKRRELESNRRIVDSVRSDEYQKLSKSITGLTEGIETIVESKERYGKLLSSLRELKSLNSKVNPPQPNKYDLEYNKAVDSIFALVGQMEENDFQDSEVELTKLRQALEGEREGMKSFLKGRNLTEENIQDVTNASERSAGIEKEIAGFEKEVASFDLSIQSFDFNAVQNARVEYKNALANELHKVSDELKNVNEHIKTIGLTLEFDEEAAKTKLFERFKEHFNVDVNTIKTKENALAETLFRHHPNALTDKNALLKCFIKPDIGKEESQAERFLSALLGQESNFEQYKLLARATYLNQLEFKNIKVLYDNKPLANSSFGQRCTAALVILLSLGNDPIIIDEPEAHLDSLLIANYLVDLVKKSKRNRQIVFATHNANLVVNGDADLIYHLAIGDDKKTVITPTTIENLETRELIVALEGGREAFLKRENKYYQT